MKVLILAGGYGTRISEESDVKPKPMIEIGSKPILWHIMKQYSHFGFNEFIILLGYKGYVIKEYFANFFLHQSDVTIDTATNEMQIHKNIGDHWKVTLVNTGLETMTGGRIKRAQEYIGNNPFMLTYGDGVADVDIAKLVEFHKEHKKLLTVTSVQPEGRFGALDLDESNSVKRFLEKPKGDGNWINGGFFVCQSEVLNYIKDGDSTIFEQAPLQDIARDGQLKAYKHEGFWQPMDTLRDKTKLNELWHAKKAPWHVWKH